MNCGKRKKSRAQKNPLQERAVALHMWDGKHFFVRGYNWNQAKVVRSGFMRDRGPSTQKE